MSIVEQILLDVVVSVFPEVCKKPDQFFKRIKLALLNIWRTFKKLAGFSVSSASDVSQNFWISLDTPPKKELGDFALSVFPYAKITKLAPQVIAEKVAEELKRHSDHFKDVSIMGGYVNFFLTNTAWEDIFQGLSTEDKPENNETIVVDYIGANAGKPLHIGHICTPSIGQTILNTHKYLGYRTIGDSHFGDWGGIFGKLLFQYKLNEVQRYLQRWIVDAQLNDEVIKEYSDFWNFMIKNPPTDEIIEIGEKINELLDKSESNWFQSPEDFIMRMYYSYRTATYFCENFPPIDNQCRLEFKKLSEWNTLNGKMWLEITSQSIIATNKILKLLNVKPQYNIGESFYEGLDLPRPNSEDYPNLEWNMKDIVKELIEKGVATQNEDGSVGVVFPEETKIPSCVLQKKDGTGLYLTSDLAAIKYRMTNGWKPSKLIYCVDSRQQLHLRQAFAIARMAWPELLGDTELFHAFNGFIKLKDGAMSTRKGTVIFLQDLITEGFNRTKAILEQKGQSLSDEDIQAIAIGAIKYSYLAVDREKDVVFDWDKALSFEGNSGPYIQYSYVRAKNIVEKAGEIGSFVSDKLELSEYDRSCLRRLSFFEKAVADTASKYKPHILATYCYELASEFNTFYVHTPKILEEQDTNLRTFRLVLIEKVAETLKKGFELLAINMPGKM